MPRKKLTTKQADVKNLLSRGQTVEQIAELMDTSSSAIKAQISRIRNAGHRIVIPTEVTVKQPATPTLGSVEEHIASEENAVAARLSEVEETLVLLEAERGELTERKAKLVAAGQALVPDAPRRLTAVA